MTPALANNSCIETKQKLYRQIIDESKNYIAENVRFFNNAKLLQEN